MTRNYVLSIVVLLMLTCAVSSQRLTGVWRLDEIKTTGTGGQTFKMTQPGMYFFTKSHYSIVRVDSDKPRSTDDPTKMTAAQLLDVYVDSFVANAGTYDIKAGKLTMKVMVAKSPTFMQAGTWVSFNVKFTGKTMTLTSVGSNTNATITNPTTYTLTRVE